MNWDFNVLGEEFKRTLDANNGEFYVEDNDSLAERLASDVMTWLLAMGWDGTVPDSWAAS